MKEIEDLKKKCSLTESLIVDEVLRILSSQIIEAKRIELKNKENTEYLGHAAEFLDKQFRSRLEWSANAYSIVDSFKRFRDNYWSKNKYETTKPNTIPT